MEINFTMDFKFKSVIVYDFNVIEELIEYYCRRALQFVDSILNGDTFETINNLGIILAFKKDEYGNKQPIFISTINEAFSESLVDRINELAQLNKRNILVNGYYIPFPILQGLVYMISNLNNYTGSRRSLEWVKLSFRNSFILIRTELRERIKDFIYHREIYTEDIINTMIISKINARFQEKLLSSRFFFVKKYLNSKEIRKIAKEKLLSDEFLIPF